MLFRISSSRRTQELVTNTDNAIKQPTLWIYDRVQVFKTTIKTKKKDKSFLNIQNLQVVWHLRKNYKYLEPVFFFN